MSKRQSRRILSFAALAVVGAGLAAAFWPQAILVDVGTVERGSILVTVDEEARTRVRQAYIVSTPIAGRLLRVDLSPGDPVVAGETVVARMLPTNPSALDVRTREQANAAIHAAEAALQVSRADLNKALADRDLARTEFERTRQLFENGTAAQAALDRASTNLRAVDATVDTAHAAISMRQADLENARATLIGFDDEGGFALGDTDKAIPMFAPATGRILQVLQQSETTLPAGAPVLEIGDIEGDLEVVVELLSTDAVKVSVGNRVIIENWGRAEPLNGEVFRIDPWGFTKYSALGVEEQRVNAVIRFTDPPATRASLGHGFRVETRIVVWEANDALIVPSPALFRENGGWAVFSLQAGKVQVTPVEVGENNGLSAVILDGLEEGAQVVLYPSVALEDGSKVADRRLN